MADKEPAFKADVENALRLILQAVHDLFARTPSGMIHPNIARAAALLDNPHVDVAAETPDPDPANMPLHPARVA